MKCFKCEKEIQGQVKYCPRCGTYLGFSDELIQRAIQGDEAAQAELYNRTYSDVYFTILSITKDEDLIMDMVQDTYLTAFRKLEQLKDSDSFCAWLKRIAHNRTLNALRDRRVLHTATTISTETEVVLEIEDDRIESLPEASMDQKETSRLVREILDALPEDQRIVVGMYYYDQLSVSEIAEELGEEPFWHTQETFGLIENHLRQNPKVIIVDEVDYLIEKSTVETLRDLHDKTGCPIVLVGMASADKKLARYPHLIDRIYKSFRFEPFDSDDIKEILTELTEISFTDEAVDYLATRTNQFRQLVKLINRIEKLAKTNQIQTLDEYTLKGILNERQNIASLQTPRQIYA